MGGKKANRKKKKKQTKSINKRPRSTVKRGHFVHAKGTSRPSSNWLLWWKEHQKMVNKRVQCVYRKCGKNAKEGAHVRKASKKTHNRQYIVPVCRKHHPKNETYPEPFKPYHHRPVLVSSIIRGQKNRKKSSGSK